MDLAIVLAKKGGGNVNPNPQVGALIVKEGRIIGQGYHEKYGKAHAEINAFKDCNESPEGATLYVTLEPCAHQGKQPPCFEAIIKNGIKRVVIGHLDPNPLVSGKGINAMRECIAGMYSNYYIKNLLILAIFIPIAFFIGLVLRPLLMNLNHLFDKKLAETDLMLCETETGVNEKGNLSVMLKVLMRDEELKEEFVNGAVKFEKRYPVMIRSGFLCMLIIPLVFLILMFSLNSKLVFLILWITSLVILCLYLICLEYFHDKMIKQLALTGLSPEELLERMKEKKKEIKQEKEEEE